uniref:tRNA dimethylallyltransferase n=1 Tax=uncultured proteobacterium RedeBAC7D11 TaxID=295350 RepID=Q5UF75_9PROT|nr:predicted tRNA delta(2)-isopentenylpyrophosphate transferase [uncultured proteobacterium RedeBAC7D11]
MKKAISILGPTHCGKTELAIEINKHFPTKIISVDSVQVYKGANIGSSKPNQKILDSIHHSLIDYLDPEDDFSVKDFLNEISNEFCDCKEDLLFVGGTMMYFYSLFNGISKLPEKNIQFREKLQEEAKNKGWKYMHERLGVIDPDAARSIRDSDSQRILRALEVNHLSKKTFSKLKTMKEKSVIEDYQKFTFAIIPKNKKTFKNQLKERFRKMLELGLIEETKTILERTSGKRIKVLETVGYKQVVDFLKDKTSFEEMIELATNASYQLAKRQITWLKKFDLDETFFSDDDDKVMKILSIIKN